MQKVENTYILLEHFVSFRILEWNDSQQTKATVLELNWYVGDREYQKVSMKPTLEHADDFLQFSKVKFWLKNTIFKPTYHAHRIFDTKGQLDSEWIYEVIVSPKMPTKKFKDFCPGSSLLQG